MKWLILPLLALLGSVVVACSAGGDPKKLAEANKELAKGDDEASKGHFDAAIDHSATRGRSHQPA